MFQTAVSFKYTYFKFAVYCSYAFLKYFFSFIYNFSNITGINCGLSFMLTGILSSLMHLIVNL